MLSPTHLAAGYLLLSNITKGEKVHANLSNWSKNFLLIWGLAVSVGMDVDFTNIANHHMTLMHYPLFWVVLCGVVFTLGKLLNNHFIVTFATYTFMAAILHLLLDTFGVTLGIYWLYPFSTVEFSFLPLYPRIPDFSEWLNFYVRQPIIFLEILIVTAALIKWIYDLKRRKT